MSVHKITVTYSVDDGEPIVSEGQLVVPVSTKPYDPAVPGRVIEAAISDAEKGARGLFDDVLLSIWISQQPKVEIASEATPNEGEPVSGG